MVQFGLVSVISFQRTYQPLGELQKHAVFLPNAAMHIAQLNNGCNMISHITHSKSGYGSAALV